MLQINYELLNNADQIYWGGSNGRVLNKEFYTDIYQNMVFLHLFTDLFLKDFSLLVRSVIYW